ncbi:PTS transporter subunit EIIC [Streptococcus pneumoniae]|nr:PTS transporter subunit EIIC [Streptococcus pneumoniae]MDS4907074.1 PTS transporter subunit EIIC [Streptococcus pneumoniae]
MDKLVAAIEKQQGKFEKISTNNYMMAIKDGFIATMPLIMFSSFLMIIIMIPKNFGVELPSPAIVWMRKVYMLTMGVLGVIVSGTVAKSLAGNVNRKMPPGKVINDTSAMLAAICGYLVLTVTLVVDEKTGSTSLSTNYLGSQGLITSFVSAFITVNVYRFCIKRDITIHLPKEVPGAISQAFRDIFPFSFVLLISGLLDIVSRFSLDVPFAQVFQQLLTPIFKGAESYPAMMLIWFMCALLWFVGIRGPSIVLPAVTALQLSNMEENAQLLANGQFPYHSLTPNFGNYIAAIGGTGATFVVPFILIFFMRSKQLKSVGKATITPVLFAVNEPLLFGMPVILNPYLFVPFLMTPPVNVFLGKVFIDFFGMNGFYIQLPWAFPGPLGLLIGTNFQSISFVFLSLILVVDILIYLPFCRAYDRQLLMKEYVASSNDIILEEETSEIMPGEIDVIKSKELKVLVLCAGSGTSAQLANAINEGAQLAEVRVIANSGAYGAHYDIMGVYDLIILAPQVRSYYREMKVDAERLGIQIVATRGMEYIHLTKNPSKSLQFVLEHYQAV